MTKKSPSNYNALQIGLHWLVALLILAAFILVWTFDNTPLAPDTFKLKLQLIAWHKWAGITVLMLFFVRLIYKLIRGTPAIDPELKPIERKMAVSVHHLLYLLMLVLPMVGWMLSSAKGYPVMLYGVWQMPDLVAKDEALAHTLKEIHELLANGLMVLVGLHAAGALKHYFIDKDGTLARMLPFLKR
ncbi:cytochrome b [Chitinibacter bivalviorum]|uniref:Cytochrome b n=1 Tax=Chitinibacter bivalviorum TaxID=2739434 RepID=A0A7H9BHZ7_9NEIS|nr:cytochrome b [Chitinibacter bivalviorum]QLG88257.1 cytochrome b [Chitinibacter bivalviorum]